MSVLIRSLLYERFFFLVFVLYTNGHGQVKVAETMSEKRWKTK